MATNVATRQRYGKLTYPFAAFEVLRNHKALEVALRFEGLTLRLDLPPSSSSSLDPGPFHYRALEVAIINAPIFGGQWELSIPGATLQDRLLDILVIEDIDAQLLTEAYTHLFSHQAAPGPSTSNWHMQHSPLYAAERSGIPGLHHMQARGVVITTAIDPQDVTLDGEVRGQTPLRAQVAERPLYVIAPNRSDR